MSKYCRKKEFSLVAYKIKYEGVSKEGGILKVDIKCFLMWHNLGGFLKQLKQKPKNCQTEGRNIGKKGKELVNKLRMFILQRTLHWNLHQK